MHPAPGKRWKQESGESGCVFAVNTREMVWIALAGGVDTGAIVAH
jgi:hypothetical protein